MTKKIIFLLLISIFITLLISGCVPNDGSYTTQKPAGFFSGIWHGWIAPISLIMGLFNGKTRIYETINSGLLYDFGYYIAIISGFGGISLFRSKRKHRD